MYAQMADFAELPPVPGTRFSTVRLVAETGSTNADLLAEAVDGGAEGRVLVTDHQRSGRGRQRRAWHDEPGNALLVSALLRPKRDHAPLIPLATGLAAVDAVGAVAGVDGLVGLKWPNDVLAPRHGERKLAGILAEATTAGPGSGTSSGRAGDISMIVVVGMGLNLRWGSPPPAEIAERAVTLAELTGRPVDRDDVLASFLVALERWLTCLEDGGPLLEAYRRVCLTVGRTVRFATSDGELRGTAVGISAAGTLLLDTGSGQPVELNAGDAHHL
jgi:BirA family biotin operon repressor/biotin-[acetyl-CoA-carboxylase] ligase